MKTTTRHTSRNILAGIVLSALPLLALAQDVPPHMPHGCGDFNMPAMQNDVLPPPPPAGMMHMKMPLSPSPLADLDLTELQQEKIFELMHAQAPTIFEKEKIARKTMHDLQLLTQSERFDTAKAKSLAEAHGKATTELIYLQTETQAKIWSLLAEAQRKQLAAQHDQHPGFRR